MDRNQIDRDTVGARPRSRFARKVNALSRIREGWVDRSDPAARSVNASLRGAEFRRFARDVERDLDPHGPLERIVTRHATRAAWALHQGLDDSTGGGRGGWNESSAARTLKISITTLDLLQGRRPSVQPKTIGLDFSLVADECSEALLEVADRSGPGGMADEVGEVDGDLDRDRVEPPIWQGRLVFDFEVSETSPVIRGTWITVSHIVNQIVDGATWADILRSHPELAEDDIRVCVAYAVAEDDSGL